MIDHWLVRSRRRSSAPIELVAFWIAILSPFVLLNLLYSGLHTPADLLTFFAVAGAALCSFAIGSPYGRD